MARIPTVCRYIANARTGPSVQPHCACALYQRLPGSCDRTLRFCAQPGSRSAMGPCNFMAPLLYLILTFSFAQAQNDCPLFTETLLGSADELSSTGLVGDAFRATSGDPSPITVQVHAAHIVCLRSGRTRDTFSGVSVIVNYTCVGPPSECTGNPILSQFEFECVGTSWSASVGGSASSIITTPPSGTFSTPRRSDCGVCLSPMRAFFGGITNNSQHCGCKFNCSFLG